VNFGGTDLDNFVGKHELANTTDGIQAEVRPWSVDFFDSTVWNSTVFDFSDQLLCGETLELFFAAVDEKGLLFRIGFGFEVFGFFKVKIVEKFMEGPFSVNVECAFKHGGGI
jgi:hypothetical protein